MRSHRDLRYDKTRAAFPATGVQARARVSHEPESHPSDPYEHVDIAHLDTVSLLQWIAGKPPGFAVRLLLTLLGHDVPANPPGRDEQACPVHSDPCPVHGYVHGAEAEELRAGIDGLIATRVLGGGAEEELEIMRSDLIRLLDKVEARDSLAFLEKESPQDAQKRRTAR